MDRRGLASRERAATGTHMALHSCTAARLRQAAPLGTATHTCARLHRLQLRRKLGGVVAQVQGQTALVVHPVCGTWHPHHLRRRLQGAAQRLEGLSIPVGEQQQGGSGVEAEAAVQLHALHPAPHAAVGLQ